MVVSTMCAHEENDPEFQQWPPHCVVGTTGQLKPQSTMLAERVVIPNRLVDISHRAASHSGKAAAQSVHQSESAAATGNIGSR